MTALILSGLSFLLLAGKELGTSKGFCVVEWKVNDFLQEIVTAELTDSRDLAVR